MIQIEGNIAAADHSAPAGRIAARLAGTPFAGQPVRKVVIVRAPDRGQLRGQITGTKTIGTVSLLSLKMRCARHGEGETEHARIHQEEADVDVVDSIAQPCRVEVLIGDVWYRHLPDFGTLYSSGRRVLIDAKREWSQFRTLDGLRQTALGQLGADALGWDYERYVLAHAGSDQRRADVEEVVASRFVPVPDRLVAFAVAALARGPMGLADLSALLHADVRNGRSMAFALMVRRVVEIELGTGLKDRAECRPVPPLPRGMPSIRR